jgi:hypothetical protein
MERHPDEATYPDIAIIHVLVLNNNNNNTKIPTLLFTFAFETVKTLKQPNQVSYHGIAPCTKTDSLCGG